MAYQKITKIPLVVFVTAQLLVLSPPTLLFAGTNKPKPTTQTSATEIKLACEKTSSRDGSRADVDVVAFDPQNKTLDGHKTGKWIDGGVNHILYINDSTISNSWVNNDGVSVSQKINRIDKSYEILINGRIAFTGTCSPLKQSF